MVTDNVYFFHERNSLQKDVGHKAQSGNDVKTNLKNYRNID